MEGLIAAVLKVTAAVAIGLPLVVYLASDTSNYIQGELLVVDGAIANHA